jgi:hypothetical protein
LHQHQNGGDEDAAEQPAPEQDGPRVERQQPREKRRRAPGHGGGDDKGDARAVLRMGCRHRGKSC